MNVRIYTLNVEYRIKVEIKLNKDLDDILYRTDFTSFQSSIQIYLILRSIFYSHFLFMSKM